MKTYAELTFVSAIFLMASLVTADDMFDMSEDELFADTMLMVDSSDIIRSSSSFGVIDSATVAFSGQLNSAVGVSASRDWFNSFDRNEVHPLASTTGNLMLDIRMPHGVKGFGNSEVTWTPESGEAAFQVQELFVDVNIANWAYIRIGKQVLQWGRCFFWNPVDLINIEKKTIQKDFGAREGSYGIKTHVPFGTRWNIYGFLDLNDVEAIDSIAGTIKIESLIGNTEVACGVWGTPGRDPVCGLDFSTSLLDFSIAGEINLTSGSNYLVSNIGISEEFDPLSTPISLVHPDEDVVVRTCVGISRIFDLFDVDDRCMMTMEYYFNQIGTDENFFKKFNASGLIKDVKKMQDSHGLPQSMLYANIGKFYEPNNHSRHYMAVTSSISKFIVNDITLSCSGIVNLNQQCGLLITSLNYQNMYNYVLGGELSAAIGPENTEYTFMGNAFTFKVYTGISF